MELIQWWRNYMKHAPSHQPREVNGGPLLENVFEGKDINIQKIPTPIWHEHDGGPYIGTGCMVVMRDPDTGWLNYGCYRVQSHEPDVASVMMSPGKHGRIIMGKYHDRGQPCPVAVIAGMHPALLMLAGLEIPYGKNEMEAAGGILGEPIEVFNMPRTGLPVPANAEIAFEGHIHPNDLVQEGPLGEWTGYYASGSAPEPAIRIATMMHRNDPILVGAIPAVPPNDNTFYLGTYRCGAVWNQLEAAGIPEGQRCVGARSRRQPVHAHRLDQAALRRPRQAGRHGGLALPCRRLLQPLDHRGRRGHRPDQHQRRDLGDVHALRPAHAGRRHSRRLELGARSDVLRHRKGPAQFARRDRCLRSVQSQKNIPDHRPLKQRT